MQNGIGPWKTNIILFSKIHATMVITQIRLIQIVHNKVEKSRLIGGTKSSAVR